MVVLELNIFPLDKGESVSEYVARAVDLIDRSGLDYQCHAMGTLIEGTFDQVMGLRGAGRGLPADRVSDQAGLSPRQIRSSARKSGQPGRKARPAGQEAG